MSDKKSFRYEEICGFASQPMPEKNEGALSVNFGGFGDTGGDANYLIVSLSVMIEYVLNKLCKFNNVWLL